MVRLRCRYAALLASALGVVTPLPAAADPATESYSDYEQEAIDIALARHEGEIEPRPQGKRIARIDVEVLDVIEQRDPAPGFLNIFHANTKDYIIERELLFSHGDRYDSQRVTESERNIRGLRQESLVIILPLRTANPDEVRVLVIAKDIWSLRLNSDFRFRGGDLEFLVLQPAEENLAGTHRRVLGNFAYEPDTITAGARFIDPRLAGSRIQYQLDGNLLVNHGTGELEGGFGSFSYGVPLYSTSQEWAWNGSFFFQSETTRRFVGVEVAKIDAVATPETDAIPYVYDSESITGQVSVTRSFGYDVKQDFTLGMQGDRNVYRAKDLSAHDPAAAQEFVEEVIPRTETRNGPFILYHFYLNQFASLLDVETMGLQESFVMGPELYLQFYPLAEVFGATRNVLGYHGDLAYTQKLGRGFMRGYVGGTLEAQLLDIGGMTVSDSLLQAGVRVVTPPFYIGRLIYDGTALYRFDNYSNNSIRIGGDGRLRGYPTALFTGENLLASNLEFRSRPLMLWTVLVGGALFYDAADAFDGSDFHLKHGAGFGLRILFPQLERSVMRIDWGFALTPDPGVTSPLDGLVVTFRQAFGVPRPTGSQITISSR